MFVEQVPSLVRPRGSLTDRAVTWTIGQLRREHATIEGLARQLGTTWKTLWRAVRPRLAELADDESRLAGVASLGVDEHVVRREALLFRMEVRDHHRRVVVAAR